MCPLQTLRDNYDRFLAKYGSLASRCHLDAPAVAAGATAEKLPHFHNAVAARAAARQTAARVLRATSRALLSPLLPPAPSALLDLSCPPHRPPHPFQQRRTSPPPTPPPRSRPPRSGGHRCVCACPTPRRAAAPPRAAPLQSYAEPRAPLTRPASHLRALRWVLAAASAGMLASVAGSRTLSCRRSGRRALREGLLNVKC